MTTIVRFFQRVFAFIRRWNVILPRDEVEKLEARRALYQSFHIALFIAVLFSGVWLDQRGHPSWMAALLIALRFLYALPASRVERALRNQQIHERENIRASKKRTP